VGLYHLSIRSICMYTSTHCCDDCGAEEGGTTTTLVVVDGSALDGGGAELWGAEDCAGGLVVGGG
jgi:hypothetical protein